MYALVIGLLLAVFAAVSLQVAVTGPLAVADVAVRDALAGSPASHGPSARLAEFGADLGAPHIAGTALAAGAVVTARRRRSWEPILLAVLAALSVPALALPLKELFARPGPDGAPLAGYAGYYPSGHTLTAGAAYGVLALLWAHRAPRAAPVCAALAATWTAAGLVLRGYHWLTDVVAGGALAGAVVAGLGLLAAVSGSRPRPGNARRRCRDRRGRPRTRPGA
ncbi:phosphatase PAP2 family protein [Streptomyces sp. TR06-5]|uniref:phosphatase PAP2 family protein n=1 Tax=unclassified Streptomyces TaxID=2593676 RepID=UPI0039A3A464